MRRLATLFAVSLVTCWLAVSSFRRLASSYCPPQPGRWRVQIDRNTGQGFEKAFLNLPITQGTKIRTGADSRAEIEFEDGTTLRLTPGTAVEFPELGPARLRRPLVKSGSSGWHRVPELQRRQSRNNSTLSFGQEKLTLTKQAHLRIEMKDANATVAVFKGEVDVDGSSGKVDVEKKHSATFDLAGASLTPLPTVSNLILTTSGTSSRTNISNATARLEQLFALLLRHQRPELLRQFLQRPRLRDDVAALPGRGRMGSVHEWRLELVSGSWIYLGIFLSLGLDAVSLRFLDLCPPMAGSGSQEAPGRDGTPFRESPMLPQASALRGRLPLLDRLWR